MNSRNAEYPRQSRGSLVVGWRWILLSLSLVAGSLHAQLPEIGDVVALSGSATSARIFAGASRDGGNSFDTRFRSHEALSLSAEIRVEPDHVGSAGRLYVVVESNGEFVMQGNDGGFQPWVQGSGPLIARARVSSLSATQRIEVLDEVPLAPLGATGRDFSLFIAYQLDADSGELYFTRTPLTVSIADYDPMASDRPPERQVELVVNDRDRSREIPLTVTLPATRAPAPVVLFSHGLGGNRSNVGYMAEQWASRGYVVVAMQHAGSDSSIYEGVDPDDVGQVFQDAANLENLELRAGDVSAVIDSLERWNGQFFSSLFRRLDLERIGMSGHSFGAMTTQITSGESVPAIAFETRDPRIDAALPLSTRVTTVGQASVVLSGVELPWLVMTGTEDVSPLGQVSVEERRMVFPNLPGSDKYELVLMNGTHNAYIDESVAEPGMHYTIAAISTAFWDSYLRDDVAAMNWLRGNGVRGVLSDGDSWQYK